MAAAAKHFVCLRSPFHRAAEAIRGSNKIIYQHNEEHTFSHSRLVEKVLGLSADYDPLPLPSPPSHASMASKLPDHPTSLFSSPANAKHTSRGVSRVFRECVEPAERVFVESARCL